MARLLMLGGLLLYVRCSPEPSAGGASESHPGCSEAFSGGRAQPGRLSLLLLSLLFLVVVVVVVVVPNGLVYDLWVKHTCSKNTYTNSFENARCWTSTFSKNNTQNNNQHKTPKSTNV